MIKKFVNWVCNNACHVWRGFLIVIGQKEHIFEENADVDRFIESCIANGRYIEHTNFEIVVELNGRKYALWNCNYPYGWLSICNLVVAGKYYEDNILVWERYQPSEDVSERFEKWLREQCRGITLGKESINKKYIDVSLLSVHDDKALTGDK
ncbi:MAG: hypothetical protein IKO41_21340 [Lachnospiraceae bacterium]|nr:hypothetical protein [Lachnospiraceae bacterium]